MTDDVETTIRRVEPYRAAGEAMMFPGQREMIARAVGDVGHVVLEWTLATTGDIPPKWWLWYRVLTDEGVEQSGVLDVFFEASDEPAAWRKGVG